MPHARLTHPLRGTLEFRQGQTDEDSRSPVADVTPELGTYRKPVVNVKARTRGRSVTGLVTGFNLAQTDPDTSEAKGAIANYLVELESHVDEFQGNHDSQPGYTFKDDLRNLSLNAVLTDLEWRYRPREPYQAQFDIGLEIGKGTNESRSLNPRDQTIPNPGMAVPARIDGNDVSGVDVIECSRKMEYETDAIYDTSTAENNDIVFDSGPIQQWKFRGQHSGTDAERRNVDATFDALEGGPKVTLELKLPNYTADGFVMDYSTRDRASRGGHSHGYELTFVEGTR